MQPSLRIGKEIDPKHLDNLIGQVGWGNRGEKRWREVLAKTSYAVSIWENETLIAFGRILEDGVMCMFYDIAVMPSHQGRGIGTMLMNHLIDQVKDKKYVSIGLFGWEKNPGNIPFYQKFGFESVPTGMELIKFMQRE